MLKARNRKLSMILVLAMLMTMFAGLGTASAAIVDYSAYGVTTVNTGTDFNKTLGSILVEIDDVVYLGAYENWVTMKMPAGVSLADADVGIRGISGSITANADVVNSSTVDIKVQRTADDGTKGKFTIYFDDVKVQSGSGNLDVTFLPQSGSILPGGTVTIANIVSKGATQAMVSSVKSLGEGVGEIDTISIAELSPNVFNKAGKVKLELPVGVKWVDENAVVVGAWAFDGQTAGVTAAVDSDDSSILLVDIPAAIDGSGKAGRLDIGLLEIDIDEDDAKKGEIKVKVSSKDFSGVTKQDLVVAKYGDFDVTLAENEVTELTAGKTGQELGSFYIEESLGKSLVAGRTITLQLPSGVKWVEAPELKVEKGAFEVENESVSSSKVRYTVKNLTNPGAAKVLFEKAEVYVEPNFEGDVELEVTGNAGVNGTVKVSEVVKAVDVSASAVPNIIIGEQNVKAGDIVIKENVAEAIQEGDIVLELAGGYEFYKKPTVKVTDGDLRIDSIDVNSDKQLIITIDKESNDASTITISDVYVTGYRYAPTGPVVAKIVAAKGNEDKEDYTGSTALDSRYGAPGKTGKDVKYSEKTVGEVTIANCITPAEGAGVAEFRIGSNIYYVGGAAKVMDVAPYIKGDRSYVPMRYVAEMLGAEVVWDDAARTVTLTKGDDIVVFTIGSESYTVNGEAMTADVAPEIANERTMLPARYVAEAFGAVVGWDAGTQTVLVQQ